MKVNLTHKGWFGPCPVYFARLDEDAPIVTERHWLFAPLFWLAYLGFMLAVLALSVTRPDIEPRFPLSITGRIQGKSVDVPTPEA